MTKTLKIDLILYFSLSICLLICIKTFGIHDSLYLGAYGTIPFIYGWIGLKALQGKYLFSKEEGKKQILGIIILLISIGIILILTYADIFEYGGNRRVRDWVKHGTFWEMLEDGMTGYESRHLNSMYIIQGILFYFLYVITSLIFQWFPKNTKQSTKVINNEKIELLIELKEAGKISSDDFVEEIKKLSKD